MSRHREFINKKQEEEIVEAIRMAEKNTSGEIRVHIEANHKGELLGRVKEVFTQLEMHQTKMRNGILFYIAANKKEFFILGDKGINEKVDPIFWECVKDIMENNFRKRLFTQGLVKSILLIGEHLKMYFPSEEHDKNELPDEISRG